MFPTLTEEPTLHLKEKSFLISLSNHNNSGGEFETIGKLMVTHALELNLNINTLAHKCTSFTLECE